MLRNSPRTIAHSVLFTLILLSVTICGCARWNQMVTTMRGPGFDDNTDSEQMAKIRDEGESGSQWSFSEKGRQIERSMGSGI